MRYNRLQFGFTFVELLVVITIILLLVTVSGVSYSMVLKKSRDSKRKGDVESIRSALEIFRSNSSSYPVALDSLTSPTIYIQTVPKDPLNNQGYFYKYQAFPAACSPAGTPCSDYVIGAYLEGTSSCAVGAAPAEKCKGSSNCNYCAGPYGQK